MANFLDHIAEQHVPELRDAIAAVHETKELLMQVQARFGTQDPAALAARIGESCDGVQVTPAAVSELESLLELHEEKFDLHVHVIGDLAAKRVLDAVEQVNEEVLRPNGMLLFSTYGPDTLMELRASWAAVDGCSHVSPFWDMHNIGDAMLQAGLVEPVVDVDRFQLTYEDVPSLMNDLKTLGAHNVTRDRPRGLTGKGRLRAMYQAYERYRREGRLPASYEVVYGHAWAPLQRQVDGVTQVSLEILHQQMPRR